MARTRTRSLTVVRQANTVRRSYQRRRSRSGRRGVFGSRKIPLAVIAGLVPGFMFALNNPEHSFRQGMERIVWTYTGIVPWETPIRWDGGGLKIGLFPLLGGFLLHAIANITGLNKALARIPYVEV